MIPDFGTFHRSAKTYMVYFDPDTHINIEKLFYNIPISSNPTEGNIIGCGYKNLARGIMVPKDTYMRNQTTLKMIYMHKKITLFVFRNCTKITGIREEQKLIDIIRYLRGYLYNMRNIDGNIMSGDLVVENIEPVMINVTFDIGFEIDRERLDQFLNDRGYISIYNTVLAGSFVMVMIPKKNKPGKTHTMLIFWTGSVLFSGSGEKEMEEIYQKLMKLLHENRLQIERNKWMSLSTSQTPKLLKSH